MGVPFTIVEGVILLADQYGNIVGTKQVSGEVDQNSQPLYRAAVDTTIRGSNSPFPTAEVDPTTKALKVILGGTISTSSSTTTPLGAGGIYTGAWVDISNVAYITVLLKADVDSATLGFTVEWSHNGATVVSSDAYSFIAGGVDPATRQYTFGAVSQYFRVQYTNGAVAQSSFVLQTVLKIVGTKGSHQRLGTFTSVEADAELMKAAMAALTPSGDVRLLNADSRGYLVVAPLSGFNAFFTFGDVLLASSTPAIVRRTAYTEPTSNAQRSIASASALDTNAAGTGARTVKITYYDQTLAGPFTETLNLNGTVTSNTVNTNICFIERIEVMTAGSTGSNAGIITLYSAINKGGTAIGTISALNNQTFWCHHYVGSGVTATITGVLVGSDSSVAGNGAVYTLRAAFPTTSNSVVKVISDFITLYGQASSVYRNYASPIKQVGPARIDGWVVPNANNSNTQRMSFDYTES